MKDNKIYNTALYCRLSLDDGSVGESGLVNHTAYFAKNLVPFSDDMTMIGASMKDGVLAFNQFSWGLGKADVFGIALGKEHLMLA